MTDKLEELLKEYTPRKFCIFFFAYGRPELLRESSWKSLDDFGSNAPRYLICSDDDKRLQDYKDMFGEERVLVFNKQEAEKTFDVGDNFQNMYKSVCFARNMMFEMAKRVGHRYFLVHDDDVVTYAIRHEEDGLLRRDTRIPYGLFDNICEAYFRMLDSAPWLYCTAMSQGGDYIGGKESKLWKEQHRWKAMNGTFHDVEKPYTCPGRINEDVNAYCCNGMRGKLFLTLAGVMLDQIPTQKAEGGMTEIYRSNGTWLKSMYSVMLCPSFISINTMGNFSETRRIHHRIEWKHAVPKVLSNKYAKGTPLKFEETAGYLY